jgi:hypothetical protein
VRHTDRASLDHLLVFLSRALNRGHCMAAVMADQVQNVGAEERAPFAVCRLVGAAPNQPEQVRNHLHGCHPSPAHNFRAHTHLHRNSLAVETGRFPADPPRKSACQRSFFP